ncbi:MAG: DUF4093 domain-containing protein [Clostridia bacterium]|nr:DUF4093 domain-containing protein [Clostridia bacterium]MBQ6708720.1 DUF4093 domain-containing protein [Clostridia bacterium]
MLKIKETVIVEGKYDKIKLSDILDTVIITTDGFGIFKDKEKLAMIRTLAEKNGILILTDSDSAGFKIRNYISSAVRNELIKHAYIPDIFGKEKRKTEPSKEGKLGVEGVSVEVIMKALENAGVVVEKRPKTDRRLITTTDLYEDGLSGRADSKKLRTQFLKNHDLPEKLSTSALIKVLNTIMTYEEYKEAVNKIGGK